MLAKDVRAGAASLLMSKDMKTLPHASLVCSFKGKESHLEVCDRARSVKKSRTISADPIKPLPDFLLNFLQFHTLTFKRLPLRARLLVCQTHALHVASGQKDRDPFTGQDSQDSTRSTATKAVPANRKDAIGVMCCTAHDDLQVKWLVPNGGQRLFDWLAREALAINGQLDERIRRACGIPARCVSEHKETGSVCGGGGAYARRVFLCFLSLSIKFTYQTYPSSAGQFPTQLHPPSSTNSTSHVSGRNDAERQAVKQAGGGGKSDQHQNTSFKKLAGDLAQARPLWRQVGLLYHYAPVTIT